MNSDPSNPIPAKKLDLKEEAQKRWEQAKPWLIWSWVALKNNDYYSQPILAGIAGLILGRMG